MPKAQSKPTHTPTKAELEKRVSELEGQVKSTENTSSQPGRSFLTWVLILVTAVLFCSAITAVWLRQTLFDTNTWVKTTSTIMKNSSVQHDIAEKTVQTIFTSVNVNQYVTELLPDKAKPLAGTITGSLQTFSTEQVQKLLASSQFDQFWQNANRQAHVALLKTIQTANDKSQPSAKDEVVFIQKDQIILNVAPVLQNLKGALVSAGLGFVNNLNVGGLNLTIPLATVQNLPAILLAVNTINNLAFWLPIVVLIFAGLTLWVSRNKRKTIMHIAIVTAVLLISSIVSINVGGYLFVTSLTAQVSAISSGSAQVVYSTLTADLLSYEKVALALMLLIVLFTYLTGTSQPALWVRDEISGLLKGEAKTPALQWLGTYSTLIIGILIAATALLIVFAPFRSAPLTLISASIAGVLSIFLLAVRKATTKSTTKK